MTPVRCFQLSPPHVSLNFSPARGTERNVQTSFPVCMSHARTSPAGPRGGFSCVRPPVMTRCRYTTGGDAQAVAAWQSLKDLGRVQLDDALVAECFVGLAGRRVEREELRAARAEHDLRRRLRVAGPVFDASRRGTARFPGDLEDPRLFARRRVQRDHALYGEEMYITPLTTSGVVWLGAKPEPPSPPASPRRGRRRRRRRGSSSRYGRGRGSHVIHPRHIQLADIRRGDLRERRKAHAAGIMAVGRPFIRGGRTRRRFRLRERRGHDGHGAGEDRAQKSLHIGDTFRAAAIL